MRTQIGGEVGRNWEELREGNCNQNLLQEKSRFSERKMRKKEKCSPTTASGHGENKGNRRKPAGPTLLLSLWAKIRPTIIALGEHRPAHTHS